MDNEAPRSVDRQRLMDLHERLRRAGIRAVGGEEMPPISDSDPAWMKFLKDKIENNSLQKAIYDKSMRAIAGVQDQTLKQLSLSSIEKDLGVKSPYRPPMGQS